MSLLAACLGMMFMVDLALIVLHTPIEAMARQVLVRKGGV